MGIKMKRITETDILIGKNLKKIRLQKGFTQIQIGNCLGVKFQQAQKYEGGINRVSAGALYKISKLLKTPIEYFFDGLKLEKKSKIKVAKKEPKPKLIYYE